MPDFYARGKLLLSAEYLVVYGAEALALPLQVGQSLELRAREAGKGLLWKARVMDQPWFEAHLDPQEMRLLRSSDEAVGLRLLDILQELCRMKPDFRSQLQGQEVLTQLEFPREYGFGSSSILLDLLSQLARVDALELHFRLGPGSGYDVACARARGPLLYQREAQGGRVSPVSFYPDFHPQLYFLWLGKKQDSLGSLKQLKGRLHPDPEQLSQFSSFTRQMLKVSDLAGFMAIMEAHEQALSKLLGLPPLQSRFPGLDGRVKSLGAWGGDFALVATPWDQGTLQSYMNKRGLHVVYPYEKLVYDA